MARRVRVRDIDGLFVVVVQGTPLEKEDVSVTDSVRDISTARRVRVI